MPLDFDSYASVQDLRDAGLPASYSDTEVQVILLLASQLVEARTRNYFREETGTFIFDGSNSHILHLPIPIIAITSLTVNHGTTVLDEDYWRAYTGRIYPIDDRKNPKIELRVSADPSSIYVNTTSIDIFLKGMDQTVVGTFGYLESDDTVPAAIHQAVMILAIQHIEPLYNVYGSSTIPGSSGTAGSVKSEESDDHKKEWYNITTGQSSDDGLWPPIVKTLLNLYRAPRAMGVTSARWSSATAESIDSDLGYYG